MIDQFYFIGCGAVGFCLLEIMKFEKLFYNCIFVIIEPREIKNLKEVMKDREYIHIKTHLTRENIENVMSCVDTHTFIVNVSVNVDSPMLLKFAKERGSHYIDTSLEQYDEFVHVRVEDITRYDQFRKNNLYHQNLEAERIIGNDKVTRAISSGMNPGMINELTKKALKRYAKSKGYSLDNFKGDYGKLGHDLGLTEIQVVEFDTQKLKVKSDKNTFVNTWSSIGFQEEASDLVMLSLNNKDIEELTKAGMKLIKPDEGPKNTHIRFVNRRGMDVVRKSQFIDDKGKMHDYQGMLIPHAEIISMSEFFGYKNDAPTISYIYRPCDEALVGLYYFQKNDYEILPKDKVVRLNEVEDGYDSIGALLKFKNGDQYIGATVCSTDDCKKFGIMSGPTTLQVVAFMLPVIKWTIDNPKKGLNNAETIPHSYILNEGEKYLGKLFFKSV